LLAATAPAAWLVVSSDAGGGTGAWRYAAILVTVTLVGWCVGAEYPLVNRLFTAAGGSVGSAAAITDAADHLGAAVGSLFAGVLLVPVAGLGVSCMLLGAVKAASLLLLVSAAIALPPGVAEE
jgi:predicted membrane-bound spermidine synthase